MRAGIDTLMLTTTDYQIYSDSVVEEVPPIYSKIALELEEVYRLKAKENQILAGKQYGIGQKEKLLATLPKAFPINTREELAKISHVSGRTLAKAKVIKEKASEEVLDKVRNGEVTIADKLCPPEVI